MGKPAIAFAVTNDLNYDQRMLRICSTLHHAGYTVTLIGFKRKKSLPLLFRPYRQIRLPIVAEQGKLMYVFYWLFLFGRLLFLKANIICAIDLDTILPVYAASVIRRKKRVYDAHEIFTELREVISRPAIHKMWQRIADFAVPRFPVGYTIGDSYAAQFKIWYGVNYSIVRNATILQPVVVPPKPQKFILYQGAVNVGRCFEQVIPAMQHVDAILIVCGEGNFYEQARALVVRHGLEEKIVFKGYVPPEQLRDYTLRAWVGITLFEATSLSNRLSLANRFFDYMHSGVPQLCVRYPEYEKINEEYEVACLIADITPENIAASLNRMLYDAPYYDLLQANCMRAREVYCWQQEAIKLTHIYDRLHAL